MVLPSSTSSNNSKHHHGRSTTIFASIYQALRRRTFAVVVIRQHNRVIGLIAFLFLALLIQTIRPYYYGPPIDVYLEPLKRQQQGDDSTAPLLPNNDDDCHQTIRQSSSSKPMAVIVIGSSRPDYLRQVLESLQHQTVSNFQVHVFLDYCEMEACQQVIKLVEEENYRNDDKFTVHHSKTNLGIARMSLWAIETILTDENNNWQRFLFLEDDHLIGHTYIEAMGYLLEIAQQMPKVAMVNGNYVDTPPVGSHGQLHERRPYTIQQHDTVQCQFQLVEPMAANTDVNGHDVWAWATTRQKMETVLADYKTAFSKAHLDDTSIPYMRRNRTQIVQVMKQYCPGSGYTQWGGQDWLRACLFYYHGMTQKLQPTSSRLMTYIGKQGMHMKPKTFRRLGFDDTTSVEDVSKSVTDYPQHLCENKICHFKIVLPQQDRWAWFRKRKKKSLGGVT